MRPRRAPARARPRRPLARRGAVLAVAAVLAALAVAAAAPRAAPPASQARPAVTATAVTTVTAARIVPAAPPSPPSPPPARATLDAASSSCGFLDVTCEVGSAITSWLAGLVTSAVGPLVALIGRTALSTPQPSSLPAVQGMWSASLAIADACYLLLVVIGGVIVMSHETLQTSYSAKEIAPRLLVGLIAANLSMVLMTRAVAIANALSAALTTTSVSQQAVAGRLLEGLAASISGGNGIVILLEVAGVILALALAAVYVLRMMAVVLLAAAAPILLSLWALPQTAWAARWWCRAWVAVLAIQVAQGLVLTAAVRVFFTPGWLPGGGLEQPLITLCLLYILARIPSWIARPVLSPFGPSPARRALRFAFTALVLSRVAPVLRGTAGRGGAGAAGRGGTGAAARAGRRPPGGGPAGPAAGARPRAGGGTGTAGVGSGGSAGTAGGGATAGAGSSSGQPRWAQPPLPGMPSPPRRPRYQQLALFGPPPSSRQPPAGPPAQPPPAGRGGGRGYRQPPLPGMPARPPRPRQLALPLDPPPRRVPRTPPEGSR